MPKVKINLASLAPMKKHAAPIACGGVALLAVIASFSPLGGYKKELQAELDKSVATKSAIDSLLNKQRNLPPVSADSAEAKPLEVFPTESVIKQGEAVVQQVTKQSSGLLTEVEQKNLHKPLIEGVLPSGAEFQKLQFRDRYKDFIENTIPVKILDAAVPPATQEVTAAVNDAVTQLQKPQPEGVAIIGPNNQVLNKDEVTQKIAERTAQIPQQMREAVAKNHKIYIGSGTTSSAAATNPLAAAAYETLSVYPNVLTSTGQAQIPDDATIFFAQVGLWIQEDVCKSLAEINGSAKSIIDAPVKHLLKITWPAANRTGNGDGSFVMKDPPGTASSIDPTAQIQFFKFFSPTGRVCGPMYDVVQFDMKVRVAAKDLPAVLEGLGRNRLITVLKVSDITSFDGAAAAAAGYFYGQEPVVEVTLQCEELFLRTWDYKYMPMIVKTKYFGIPADQPAPAAAGAAASAG